MKRVRLVFGGALVALVAAFVIGERAFYSSGSDTAANAAIESASGAPANAQGGPTGRHDASARGGAGPIAVQTAVATSKDVPIIENSVGWVEPIESVAVHTLVDGTILHVDVKDGDTVKAGDVLFRLDDAALQAIVAKDRANVAKDQAILDQARADLDRDKTLAGYKNAVTVQQVEQQQAQVDVDVAAVAVDSAQLQADQVQLNYATVKAPIAGRIGVVNFTQGAIVHVSDQTPLLTVTQMAPLRVSYTVPERDLDRVRQALAAPTPAAVRVFDPASSKLLSTGVLAFIDSSIDTSSGTVTLKANFDNADGVLWPGEYLKIESELGVHQDATVIPLAALQVNEKGPFVFVAKPDGTVATQSVTVAGEAGDTAIVDSGVNPNDHVVVEGQLRLHDGSAIKETALASSAPTAPPDLRQ